MSLYNDASLVLIPSGYKEGKLYSIKPTDGGGDFTFSRASSATRVNSSGLIEKETQNLLLQSNQFDTTWAISGVISVTSGQSGYDGSSDAWLVTKTSGIAFQGLRQSISSSGVQSVSLYAKAGTLNVLALYISGGTNPYVSINLSDGSVNGQRGTEINVDVQSVGVSGWYRITFAFNESGSDLWIYPDWDGTNNGNLYIQDAQLEQGLVARDYIETTTTAVYGGITDDLPRLDYTDASCPSLLLEWQRTNLITQSEYFGAWSTFGGAVLTHNDATSPEGVVNAVNITSGGIFKLYSVAANTDYVFSVFVKTDTATSVELNYVDQTSPFRGGTITYTFATNSVAVTNQSENNSVSADREDYGNGWVRVIMKFKTNVAKNYDYQEIKFVGGDGWIYGAQLEAGSTGMSIPTSYIPTYGTAVTRVSEASAFELSVFDFFSLSNTESGSFFIETKFINQGNTYVDTFSQGGSGTNVWQNTDFVMLDTVSSNSFVVQNLTSVIDDYVKILIRKDQTTYNVFINGVKSATTNTITNPLKWFDHIALFRNTQMVKQMIEFPTALTDSECIALTTL